MNQIRYEANINIFNNIPGNIFVYWVGQPIFDIYKSFIPLKQICEPKQGIAASGNDLFLRRWYEVQDVKSCFIVDEEFDYLKSTAQYTWYPYSKGGEFRKWYGNEEFLFNYQNEGYAIWHHKGAVVRNPSYYFKKSIGWSDISSSKISFKYKEYGHIFDAAGPCIFFKTEEELMYCLTLLNSKVIEVIAKFMSPALHFSVGQVAEYPYRKAVDREKLVKMAKENISITKDDWDSFETSWDFKKHPLI